MFQGYLLFSLGPCLMEYTHKESQRQFYFGLVNSTVDVLSWTLTWAWDWAWAWAWTCTVWVPKDTHASGPSTEIEMFHSARQINVYLRDNKSQNNSLAYEYIQMQIQTYAHTATVSSNIIEVWQWKANRKTRTQVYMLKQLLSLQKIGFLLQKWFAMSPFVYLTYTLTIRRYEIRKESFLYKLKEKYSFLSLLFPCCQFD